MSLLLLFAYTPLAPSVPISELVQTAPLPGVGYPIQRPASSGEWRFGLEVADPQAGDSIVWHDITRFYAGDVYQRGADDYLGKYRAAVAQVQLQTDNDDLAPWGQDTTDLFGTNVELDGGLLMRATLFRVDASVTVEWAAIWTGRVETWGDASAARGQIRTHVVTVTDTITDLANVPTIIPLPTATWDEWYESLLQQANWLFGIDMYGDFSDHGGDQDLVAAAAINRMDSMADPFGLVWRSRRNGRLLLYPAPWDTTNTDRWSNPLLDVYPSGLIFSYSPDFTDIEYIDDDEQQPFGIERTSLGVLNSFVVTLPGPDVYAVEDPVSMARYGVRPFTATWIGHNPPAVDDLLAARAYSSSQALPLRTTLDHEGFWSAMSLIDQFDPVTVIHATSDTGPVVTAPGTVRNVTEERTVRGAGSDGVMLLSWQSTVQVDVTSTTAAPALLPVENLRLIATNTPLLGGPSSAEFAWDNPVQPSVTPTEVQLRVLGRSLIWFSESYPGVGADGTTLGFLSAATTYTLQVRLVRRENGVITAFSASRQVTFTTPALILPTPTPGDDPTDSNVDMDNLPFEDCEDDVSIELQEQTVVGGTWTTVDTFDGAEIVLVDGVWHLVDDIPNSFFNDGSMYRFLGFCGDDLIVTGLPFDPPDDWTDPCPEPAALSDPPFDDPSLLVYVPKVCTGFEDADPAYIFQGMLIIEAVSGIAGVAGDALASIGTTGGSYALVALADPEWSDTPGGIVAYGECPQVIGQTGDKTITVRVNVNVVEDCVLFEVAGMRLTCVAVSSTTWRAAVVVYKVGGVTITLPTATLLDDDTEYVISATSELATGDITISVDGVEDNSVGGSDNVATIAALPIWRVGAPPDSWITDCALFGEVVVPPFSPDDIAGLAYWVDASDAATVINTAGAVTQWNDKSGNNRNVTDQGTSAQRPTTGTRTQNGLNVIDFDGSSDGLAILGGLAPFWFALGTNTMFVVYQVDADPTGGIGTMVYEASYALSNPEYGLRFTGAALTPTVANDAGTTVNGSGADPTDAVPHWATFIDSLTQLSIAQDGGTPATVGYTRATTTLNTFSLGFLYNNSFPGGGRYLNGFIAEVIIYDSVLSGGDIALVETYLQDKWGL